MPAIATSAKIATAYIDETAPLSSPPKDRNARRVIASCLHALVTAAAAAAAAAAGGLGAAHPFGLLDLVVVIALGRLVGMFGARRRNLGVVLRIRIDDLRQHRLAVSFAEGGGVRRGQAGELVLATR